MFIANKGWKTIRKYEQRGGNCSKYDDRNYDNGDGMFVCCNGFDVTKYSLERVDEGNSPVANDNYTELHLIE